MENAKKLLERQSDVQDSPTHSASMRFQGSRNSSNSKCCEYLVPVIDNAVEKHENVNCIMELSSILHVKDF